MNSFYSADFYSASSLKTNAFGIFQGHGMSCAFNIKPIFLGSKNILFLSDVANARLNGSDILMIALTRHKSGRF